MPNFIAEETGCFLVPVDLSRQLVGGTFAHALHHLLEHKIDLARIESHYHNEQCGAPAYAPRVLLKIVLLAYSQIEGFYNHRRMHSSIGYKTPVNAESSLMAA